MSKKNRNRPPSSHPFWKNSLIKALQATINLLESTVVKLDQPQTDTHVPKQLSGWSIFLQKIRSQIPALTKLSDTALTSILAGITVILVWTTVTLSSQETQVVTVPTPQPTIPPAAKITTQETGDSEQRTAEITQQETGDREQGTAEITISTPVLDTTDEEETASLPEVEIKPEAKPVPLTPEQTLIAAVQNQVSEISDRFANGLIESIQANFVGSNLTIKISNNWYNLEQSEQNQLAAQIFQRSQELDFTHLEITDLQGELVARNPVVGTQMVIFRRHG